MLDLIIGNKNYSSWSLRAWLYLRECGIEFREIHISLFDGEWREQLGRFTPAGRVPVLRDGDLVVWDSMAIIEHVRERFDGAVGWPEDAEARAMARSVSAEMHSGFLAIRDELPQNLRADRRLDPASLSNACRGQIARVEEIIESARSRHGAGLPWLFGAFSIADVFYAPVALRFATYGIPLGPAGGAFIEAVRGLPSVREFVRAAEEEEASLPFIDELTPTEVSPLTPG